LVGQVPSVALPFSAVKAATHVTAAAHTLQAIVSLAVEQFQAVGALYPYSLAFLELAPIGSAAQELQLWIAPLLPTKRHVRPSWIATGYQMKFRW